VLGIPAEYIHLTVKVITTLTLPLQRGGNNIAKFQFSFYMTGVQVKPCESLGKTGGFPY
jgi:hypothetical protein